MSSIWNWIENLKYIEKTLLVNGLNWSESTLLDGLGSRIVVTTRISSLVKRPEQRRPSGLHWQYSFGVRLYPFLLILLYYCIDISCCHSCHRYLPWVYYCPLWGTAFIPSPVFSLVLLLMSHICISNKGRDSYSYCYIKFQYGLLLIFHHSSTQLLKSIKFYIKPLHKHIHVHHSS
jgi:hypothetical protein